MERQTWREGGREGDADIAVPTGRMRDREMNREQTFRVDKDTG
jgi:hypothetical protein